MPRSHLGSHDNCFCKCSVSIMESVLIYQIGRGYAAGVPRRDEFTSFCGRRFGAGKLHEFKRIKELCKSKLRLLKSARCVAARLRRCKSELARMRRAASQQSPPFTRTKGSRCEWDQLKQVDQSNRVVGHHRPPRALRTACSHARAVSAMIVSTGFWLPCEGKQAPSVT